MGTECTIVIIKVPYRVQARLDGKLGGHLARRRSSAVGECWRPEHFERGRVGRQRKHCDRQKELERHNCYCARTGVVVAAVVCVCVCGGGFKQATCVYNVRVKDVLAEGKRCAKEYVIFWREWINLIRAELWQHQHNDIMQFCVPSVFARAIECICDRAGFGGG